MKRKSAISLQHLPHFAGSRATYIHSPRGLRAAVGHHEGPELWSTQGQRAGRGKCTYEDWRTKGTMWAASRDGSCHLPCCAEAPWPQQDVRLTCPAMPHQTARKTLSLGDRQHQAGSCLAPCCCFSPRAHGVGMGSREGADAWSTPEHWHGLLGRNAPGLQLLSSRALSRDLPAATSELWYDVPHHSPRHTRLRGTANSG